MAITGVRDAVSDVSDKLRKYENDIVSHQLVQAVEEHPPIIVRVAKSLSTHEWFLLIGVVVSMYLVNGTYAGVVCSLCTNLPAVVHSYRVITHERMPLVVYQSVLCYWILLGSLTVFDHTLANTFCYFFIKFLLLSAVYAHVVSKSRKANIFNDDIVVQRTFSCSPLASQQIAKTSPSLSQLSIQNAAPLTAKDSSFANYLEWMKRKTGDVASAIQGKTSTVQKNQFSSNGLNVIKAEKQEPAVRQHRGDGPEVFSDIFSPGISDFGEVMATDSSSSTVKMTNKNVLKQRRNANSPIICSQANNQTTAASTDWSRTFSGTMEYKQSLNDYGCLLLPANSKVSTVKNNRSVESVSCFENDIASNPMHTIMFRSPFKDQVSVTLTNITTSKIMWALKTNAIDKIIATPTCGFMTSGSTVHLKLALRESASTSNIDSAQDRLAIDYVLVENDCVIFDPARITIKTAALRRKAFKINYSD